MEPGSRTRVAQFVTATPGASTRRVAEALALDDTTVDYHLSRLARDGHVVLQRQGRENCWFAASARLCPVLRRAVPALRRDETRAVALAMDDLPRSAADLATRAGVPMGASRWALTTLKQAGLATSSRNGRVRLSDGAEVCLQKALAAERCDRWGACPVSRMLEAAEREKDGDAQRLVTLRQRSCTGS